MAERSRNGRPTVAASRPRMRRTDLRQGRLPEGSGNDRKEREAGRQEENVHARRPAEAMALREPVRVEIAEQIGDLEEDEAGGPNAGGALRTTAESSSRGWAVPGTEEGAEKDRRYPKGSIRARGCRPRRRSNRGRGRTREHGFGHSFGMKRRRQPAARSSNGDDTKKCAAGRCAIDGARDMP